jgi:hypothetical protein
MCSLMEYFILFACWILNGVCFLVMLVIPGLADIARFVAAGIVTFLVSTLSFIAVTDRPFFREAVEKSGSTSVQIACKWAAGYLMIQVVLAAPGLLVFGPGWLSYLVAAIVIWICILAIHQLNLRRQL